MGKKKATDKKKKGPKGKIARGKAKLERQWGEVAKEDAVPKRSGKSRILSRQKQANNRKTTKNNNEVEEDNGEVLMDWNDPSFDTKPAIVMKSGNDDDDDDSYSSRSDAEEEGDEIDGGGAFYSKLLNTIRKTKQNNNFDSGDDSEEEDEDSAMEDDDTRNTGKMMKHDSDDESDDGEEDDKMKATTEQAVDEAAFDFFGKRFSNNNSNNQNDSLAVPALPEDEAEREEIIRQLHQQTKKIGVPHVDPMLELQASKEFLEDMGVSNNSNNMSKLAWKKLAYQSFGCNRDLLKRRWEELMANRNNNLSSLQSVIYPFVTRYADCLITCKNKKVRITRELVWSRESIVLENLTHLLTKTKMP